METVEIKIVTEYHLMEILMTLNSFWCYTFHTLLLTKKSPTTGLRVHKHKLKIQ